jgi:hypothetical protein
MYDMLCQGTGIIIVSIIVLMVFAKKPPTSGTTPN